MVRLFQVYYPVRTVVLFGVEALIICASFLLATFLQFGPDSSLVLGYQYGFYKILGVTLLGLMTSHYLDLYDMQRLTSGAETYFRVLIVLGTMSFAISALGFVSPKFMMGNNVFLLGLIFLSIGLMCWRWAYSWLVKQPYLREKVYVLGSGQRAQRLIQGLRRRSELGMEVVAWNGSADDWMPSRDAIAANLMEMTDNRRIDRVIVAMSDRRGITPMKELLDLRIRGVKVEDATSLLEKISGKIEIDELYPSFLIFSEGFRHNALFMLVRRIITTLIALALLLIILPIIPLIALAIKLSSPGPVMYKQKRVGRRGWIFHCYKFRTMRQDAEADTGPTWAGDDDPRITSVGRFLRKARLDEIPQLWNVLKGDMGFIGPRPERPEFVEWLTQEIPYYPLRHTIRPGLTGWAQVSYQYGNTVEDSKEKLQYDLYYIKNLSLGLDLLITFLTVKTVLLGRGAK
jgi:sugar transferase (PEP-CTERM system associated)